MLLFVQLMVKNYHFQNWSRFFVIYSSNLQLLVAIIFFHVFCFGGVFLFSFTFSFFISSETISFVFSFLPIRVFIKKTNVTVISLSACVQQLYNSIVVIYIMYKIKFIDKNNLISTYLYLFFSGTFILDQHFLLQDSMLC